MADEIGQYPEPSRADGLRAAIQITLNGVPIVGGGVADFIGQIFAAPVERRRVAWQNSLADLVSDIARKQVTPEQLSEDEEWVSAVAQASRVAMGTHVEEKIRMLQAILRRAALDSDRDMIITGRFIRLVDEFEPQHFVVLRFAEAPQLWLAERGIDEPQFFMGSRIHRLHGLGLDLDATALDAILGDLETARLARVGAVEHQGQILGCWATDLGRLLLRWIEVFE